MKKRSRRHLSETDEFMGNNNEGSLVDTITMSSAYEKMKSVCLNIKEEIFSDIEIHNQNILPRYPLLRKTCLDNCLLIGLLQIRVQV